LLFDDDEPAKLEAIDTPLVDRFTRSRGLLVLNDEAHHVWDETGHARFEQRAKEKARLGKGRGRKRRHGVDPVDPATQRREAMVEAGSALQVDLSATLFEEAGAEQVDQGRQDDHRVQARRPVPPHRGEATAWPTRSATAS
jgi:hypothetical protein